MLKQAVLLLVVAIAAVVAQEVRIYPRDEAILREEGESVELTCRVIPRFILTRVTLITKSMTWIGPDGQEIHENARNHITPRLRHSLKLKIDDVQPEDAGLYQCRVQMEEHLSKGRAMEVVQGISLLVADAVPLHIVTFNETDNTTVPPANTTEPPGNDTLILDQDFHISLFNDSAENTTEPPGNDTVTMPPGNDTMILDRDFHISLFNDSNENTTEPPGNDTVTVPPGNDTMILDRDFHISLFNDSNGNTTEPPGNDTVTVPPGNDTMILDQDFHISLFNDSAGNTTEPPGNDTVTVPPGNDTMILDQDFHISLFNDSNGNTTEPPGNDTVTVPPGNDTMIFDRDSYISLFNDTVGNTTEPPGNETTVPPPGNDTLLGDLPFQISAFNETDNTTDAPPPSDNSTASPPNTTAQAELYDSTADCRDLSGTWYEADGSGRLLLRQTVGRVTGFWKATTARESWVILRGQQPKDAHNFRLIGAVHASPPKMITFVGDCQAYRGEELLKVKVLTYISSIGVAADRKVVSKTFYRSQVTN